MKLTLTTHAAAELLKLDFNASWSYAGAFAIAEWFEEIEESTGEEINFDVVAIRCDFSEYESALEAVADYHGGIAKWDDYDKDLDEADLEDTCLDYLHENTTVIEFDGGVIVQAF